MKNQNQDQIKAAFESPRWYLKKTSYNIRIRIETVQEYVQGRAFNNILDIGCGDGSLSAPLVKHGKCLTLLDRSRAMLDIALKNAEAVSADTDGRWVSAVNQDFMEAQLSGNYDLILCVGVLAYVENLEPFVAKISTLLAPGGAVIMEFSDGTHPIRRVYLAYDNASRVIRAAVGKQWFQTMIRPGAQVEAELSEAGFYPIKTFRYSQPPPISRRIVPQNIIYNAVRIFFGRPDNSRLQSWGSECIYLLKRK